MLRVITTYARISYTLSFAALLMSLFPSLTCNTKAQLSTHHSGVHITPSIISHCAPDSIEAHLNTTFIFKSPAHQPDITMTTRTYMYEKKIILVGRITKMLLYSCSYTTAEVYTAHQSLCPRLALLRHNTST